MVEKSTVAFSIKAALSRSAASTWHLPVTQQDERMQLFYPESDPRPVSASPSVLHALTQSKSHAGAFLE